MFKPVPMQRIELSLLKENASAAALLLAEYGCFNPEISDVSDAQLPELPGDEHRKAYNESRSRLDKILAHYALPSLARIAAPMQPVDLPQLTELDAWLKQTWDNCSADQERLRQLRDEYRRSGQMLKALAQFMELNIDLALLHKDSRVLDLRVGTLPRANLQRFSEALALAGYVAIRFFTNPEQVHLIIAGPAGRTPEVERVLQAAGWRVTDIPAEFRGHPRKVRDDLTRRMIQLQAEQASLQRSTEAARNALQTRLHDADDLLQRAEPYAELATLMRGRGYLVMVSGWIPERELPRLQQMLREKFGGHYVLHARAPLAEERLRVPSLIQHHRWLRPFARLVLNYGVPRYGEIDPTVLFAVSFVLMFGMMFGDIGHGAVIAFAALLLRKRFGQYAPLGVAAGVSSMCFGAFYGSVFGFEHVLPALWMSPLSDPMLMLGIALGWGAGFILLATLLTIRNRITEGRLGVALLDSHGAAGLALYLGLLLGAYRYATSGRLSIAAALLVVASLASMLGYLWQHNRNAAIAERTLIVLMECFESVMAYISNTLSFLRLAAFSLNHVALSIAIFTVANMLHSTGYWVTVVLGNVFVLVLEGAIVAIQTLRLEYYEGFSRFFGGDGRPFQPLRLGNRQKLAMQD